MGRYGVKAAYKEPPPNIIGARTEDEYYEWMAGILPEMRWLAGFPNNWDVVAQHQVDFLMELGLSPEHSVLEVGAGCLDAGHRIMAYLQPGNYWFIEPDDWMVDIAYVASCGVAEACNAHRYSFDDFKLTRTGHKFDFILAHSIFTHASQRQIATIMREAYDSLLHEKHACFVATFYDQGFGDNTNEGWTAPNGVVYTAKCMKRLANLTGFGNIQICRDMRHPAKHTWIIARI